MGGLGWCTGRVCSHRLWGPGPQPLTCCCKIPAHMWHLEVLVLQTGIQDGSLLHSEEWSTPGWMEWAMSTVTRTLCRKKGLLHPGLGLASPPFFLPPW